MKSTNVLMGAMGLLAVNSQLPVNHEQGEGFSAQKVEALKVASLNSIASSWLNVPTHCKARGFNADAEQQSNKQASHQIQAIYASYEV